MSQPRPLRLFPAEHFASRFVPVAGYDLSLQSLRLGFEPELIARHGVGPARPPNCFR